MIKHDQKYSKKKEDSRTLTVSQIQKYDLRKIKLNSTLVHSAEKHNLVVSVYA